LINESQKGFSLWEAKRNGPMKGEKKKAEMQ
jgi:hypothetical protein